MASGAFCILGARYALIIFVKEPVGIGIIGTGFARRVQIPVFMACKNAAVVSVASGNAANARAAAGEYGIGHYTDDWRETVSHPEVDLVCITTPPNLHREMALFAIEHGKHVLCEKPMAMNAKEAAEMLAAARNAGVLALIDHELRFLPSRRRGYAMLREGAIGKIRHAKYDFRAPHRADANLPWNWWSDAAQGGGALGAIASHVIDSFNWFLGAEISDIYCQLQTHVKQRPFEGGFREVTTDDEANMLLRFASGDLTEDATGMVSIGMVEIPKYRNRMEFFGTDGAMRIDETGELFIAHSGDKDWRLVETDAPIDIPGLPGGEFPRGFAYMAQRIIDAIKSGAKSVENAATFRDGLMVQNVLDAARDASESGKMISI